MQNSGENHAVRMRACVRIVAGCLGVLVRLAPACGERPTRASAAGEGDSPRVPMLKQPLTPTLVTWALPDLLGLAVRWQAEDRPTSGTPSPWESEGLRLPFHRTRTVAWAACEARLRKDGIRWTPLL